MKQYTKQDDNTLKITDEIIIKPAVSTYIYDDLVSTRDGYIAEKIRFNLEIDQKINDAQILINEADKLGIISNKDSTVV